MKRLAWLLLLLVAGCGGRAQAPVVPEIRVEAARQGSLVSDVSFGGNLRAQKRASVGPQVTGVVTSVLVAEGDRVTRGEPLLLVDRGGAESKVRAQETVIGAAEAQVAQLESQVEMARVRYDSDLRQAEEALAQARIGLEEARMRAASSASDVKRLEELYKGKAVPMVDVEKARSDLRLDQQEVRLNASKVAAAESALRTARASTPNIASVEAQLSAARNSLAGAQVALDDLRAGAGEAAVRSPMDGSVVTVNARPGQTVAPGGEPLVLIVDNSSVEFVAGVDQETLGALRPGAEVSLTPLELPGVEFRARIREVVPTFDPKTRTVQVRFRLDRRDPRLLDGMAVRAHVAAQEFRGLLVPLRAVFQEGGSEYVVVVRDGRAERRKVDITHQDETHAVVSQGLSAGESVAVEAARDLPEGQPVQVRSP